MKTLLYCSYCTVKFRLPRGLGSGLASIMLCSCNVVSKKEGLVRICDQVFARL